MGENKKTPSIRFAGFTDDWEQRKLNDYLDVSAQKNREELYSKVDVLSVSGEFGIVNQIKFQGRSFAGVSVANYGVVESGDIVYTKSPLKSNPYGIIKTNKGETGIVSTLYAVYKPKENTDPDFVQIYFEQDVRINNYMQPLVNKGAKNDMKVSDENALKGAVIFPKIDEQKKISEYFERIDKLITLHQRKYEKLVVMKKSMLGKMFPQNGSDVPEIRFEGFTDPWKQRKLWEYCEMYNGDRGINYPNDKDMVSDGIPFINAGDLKNGKVNLITSNKITREKYSQLGGAKLQLGDIVYCLRGTLGKNAFIDNFDEGTVASSLVALRPKNIDGKYLFHILNSDIEFRQRTVCDEGAAQPNLSAKNLGGFEIPISKIEEQIKISRYLDNLDNLITLHQRKLEKLKNIKKSMLEKMFV